MYLGTSLFRTKYLLSLLQMESIIENSYVMSYISNQLRNQKSQ